MPRLTRLWAKKRGDRRTWTRRFGSVGEAIFFASLFLLGAVALAAVATWLFFLPSNPFSVVTTLVLLVLLSFLAIGGGGFAYTLFQVGASVERRSVITKKAADDLDELSDVFYAPRPLPYIPSAEDLTDSPGTVLAYRLPVGQSTIWRPAVAGCLCAAICVVTAILLVTTVQSYRQGRPDVWMTLLIPAMASVSGWTFYYFVRQLVTLAGIGPTSIEVSDLPLMPGRRYRVFISQTGEAAMKMLEALLVCEEVATYRQGTDVRTEAKAVFKRRLLYEQAFALRPDAPLEREVKFELPAEAMHSFRSRHNAINWKLLVRGQAKGRPPFERSFPLVVHPLAKSQLSA